MTLTETPKAAVIGCGKMGCSFDDSVNLRDWSYSHAHSYYIHPSIDLVALYDTDRSASTKYAKKYNCRSASTLSDLFEDGSIDIISICTPPTERLDLIRTCIDLGVKAIFCEKPLALTLQEGKEIAQLCYDNNIGFICNHLRRYSPFYSFLGKYLNPEQNPTSVHCTYSGGVFNTGTHLIDTLNIIFGDVVDISHVGQKYILANGDFNINFNLTFARGVECVIQATGAPLFEMSCIQPHQRLDLNLTYPFNTNPLCRLYKAVPNPIFPGGQQFVEVPEPLPLKHTAPSEHFFMSNALNILCQYLKGELDIKDLLCYSGLPSLQIINRLKLRV